MILSDTVEERKKALAKLLPMQKTDFYKLLKIMEAHAVIIRLLDAPLHEFLPHNDEEMRKFIAYLNSREEGRDALSEKEVRARCDGPARVQPHARPPRLPHRRLLSRRSTRCRCGPSSRRSTPSQKEGVEVAPEIMIPIIMNENELKLHRLREEDRGASDPRPGRRGARRSAQAIKARPVPYKIGTMVELPVAALGAGRARPLRPVLLLRHQRPDPDHHRPLARRLQLLHAGLHPVRPAGRQPLPDPEPAGEGADRAGRAPRQDDAAGPRGRAVRGARGHSREHPVLHGGGAGLRVLLAVLGAHRQPDHRPDESGKGSVGLRRMRLDC